MLYMNESELLLGKNVGHLIERGLASRKDLADAMGISTQAVGQLIAGQTKGLKPLNLINAARRLGVSVEDLVTRQSWDQVGGEPAAFGAHGVPVLDTRASMGQGALLQDHCEVVRHISVDLPELRRRVSFSSPDKLRFITGYGDSMEPTFSDGDTLLVDAGVFEVRIDAVYVLELKSELYIKRLQRRPDGSVLMISDNKKYEPYVINNGEIEGFRVLGRVISAWNLRKL